MSRVALVLVLLPLAEVASAADLPPGALVRLGDDRFRAGSGVYNLAISPDGKQYATAHDAGTRLLAVTVWDSDTGRPVREHAVNSELFKGFVWGKGGAFAITARVEQGPKDKRGESHPDDFRVWDFTAPNTAPPLLPPLGLVERTNGSILDGPPKDGPEYTDFHFSADGRRVAARWESAAGKHAVHVFELKPAATAAKLTRVGTIDLGAEGAGAVRVTADGKTLVTFRALANSSGMAATVWDVAAGKPQPPMLVSNAAGLAPTLIDVPTGKAIAHRLMLAPDGRSLALHAADEKEWGFDVAPLTLPYKSAPRKPARIRLPYGPANEFLHRGGEWDGGGYAFFPAGEKLAVATDRFTVVIDTVSGKELGRLEGHADTPSAVAVSADGTVIATADEHGLVRLWDAKTYRPVHDVPGHRAPVEHAELSPDGKRLLTWAKDDTVRLWDVATGQEVRAFLGAHDDYRPVFTPDGTAVIYSNKKSLIARDLQTGLEVPLPKNADDLKPRAAIRSTPRLSASVHSDSTDIRVRESASNALRRTLAGHRGEVRILGFTPDGTKLLTAGGDHTVLVWDMRLQHVPLPDAVKKETSAAKLWDTLATGTAKDAYLAMARLAREPDAALKMAKMRLKPATKEDRGTDAANLADARAVELLEALDTDESRALLKELAAGHADVFRTQEAKRALERHR